MQLDFGFFYLQKDEDAVEFAQRVKKEIALRGGLVDLDWDGGLKRQRVPERLIHKQQNKYFQRMNRFHTFSECEPPLPAVTRTPAGTPTDPDDEQAKGERVIFY